MITKRIIACLDVHAGRVVKGVKFVDIVDAGDPATQAARHAREGADEIAVSYTHLDVYKRQVGDERNTRAVAGDCRARTTGRGAGG